MIATDLQEEQIRLRLIAEGQDGLFEVLQGLKGQVLDHCYVLQNLFAVGGQSILWQSTDLENPQRPALVRMVMLPYHRPAYIRESDIWQARRQLENEARMLRLFDGQYFPRLYDLIYAPNPLHPAALGSQVVDTEPYLVMELIDGITLAHYTRISSHHAAEWDVLAQLGSLITPALLDLFTTLLQLEDGYLYTDLNPKNLILPKTGQALLRVLDVGSLIPDTPTPGVKIPFSWEYIPPDYYEAYQNGAFLWPTQQFVLYTLGKLLWQLFTNRHPMPGEDPDLTALRALPYPSDLTAFVAALIKMEFADFSGATQAIQQIEMIKLATSRLKKL